jgi:DNA damage-binding protein 1
MTAVHALDEDLFIGAENGCNLFCLRRHHDEVGEVKRRWLETVATFHSGEFINRFRKGTLMHYQGGNDLMTEDAIAKPRLLFGTVSGMIGVVASLKPDIYDQLVLLQHNLRQMMKSVGKFDHQAFRDFVNDRRSVESVGFIDGDLVERFLELPADRMLDAVSGSNLKEGKSMSLNVDEVQLMVEDLARMH